MVKHHSNDTYPNVHWSWHILVAVAVLLIGTAALLSYLQSAQLYLDPTPQYLLATICGMTGIICLVPWSLRRVLSRDWRTGQTRYAHCAVPPAYEITPQLTPRLQDALWLVLALWAAWVIQSLIFDERLAARLTLENGLLQHITVVCYGAAAVLFFRLVMRTIARHQPPGLRRWWFLILALACMGVAGEEINWGQSLIPYATPDVLSGRNIQHEFNLHNIELPGLPGRHWANVVLWGLALFGGLVLPICLLASQQIRRLTRIAEIPAPPWVSQGYFLAAAIIPRDGDMLGRLSRDNIPSELREVTIAIAMLIWAWGFWREQVTRPADAKIMQPDVRS